MEVSPEGTVAEAAEAGGGQGDASAEVEHDESLHESTHLEDDLPDVVFAEVSGVDALLNELRGEVCGGGLAGLEIFGEASGAGAGFEEHELEEAGVLEGVVEEEVEDLVEALFEVTGEAGGGDAGGELFEAGVGDGVKEAGTVGVVAVDSHGGDADGGGDAAHGDGLFAFGVEELAGSGGDFF
jgi:hypothetical protein